MAESSKAFGASIGKATGEMVAVNQNTGKIEWDDKLPSSPYGAAAVTNNVVFTTTYNGFLYAFNAATGALVLKMPLSAGTNSPVTIDGDYVIVGRRHVALEGRAATDHRLQTRSQGQARHHRLVTGHRRHRHESAQRLRRPPRVPRPPSCREADMGEPAIAVRGLRKSFGAKEAVAGIDLDIAAGSLAGLVGPNGAGKTTSLSMMTGLLRPDLGQVQINGLDMWADPAAAKAVIGVVPAEARLFERLSGAELLEYSARLRGLPADEARSRAAQLLDVLDLTGDAKRLVADYSTGMRKKAALGCALIHNPSVLFLDEPLEGVDPVSADVIRRLLMHFVCSGSTVLFSSHVMELVEQVCDHVSIIDKGQIVATGPTDQVRGGKTLQQAFIDLVGSRASDGEGLSWLGSSSS